MAFGGATTWEVNSGGSDVNNGGGFDTLATFATDLAATLATSAAPVVTSASYNFITRDNAQYLFIGGGTNWTKGMYPVTTTSGNAATLNAAVGAVVLYNAAGQPTGLNTVAGCATTASPTSGTWGMDYSRGTAPIFSYTDMVIDGTTNTKFTSALNPVGPHIVGNLIVVTSGTGFTAQWVEVLSVSGTTATCDKSLGTLSSTGGHGGLGGALASPGKAGALHVATNLIALCAAGSIYGMSATNNVAAGKLSLSPIAILFGYTSNRYIMNTDAKPQVKPTANSYTLVYFGSQAMCRNIAFVNPDAHTANVCTQTDNGNSITESCTADSFAIAFSVTFGAAQMHNLYISNIPTSGVGISAATAAGSISGVEIRGSTGASANGINMAGTWNLSDFIVSGVSGIGVNISGSSTSVKRGIVYGCGSDGVNLAGNSNLTISNVHCEGNTGLGFNAAGAYTLNRLINCSAYSNTGGNVVAGLLAATMAVQGFLTLTASAFTSTSGHDFSLNNTAGGGAVLRAAGFPGIYPGGTTTSYSDVGAAQHLSIAGATSFAY